MKIRAPLLFASAFVLVLYAGLAVSLPADVGATSLEAIRWMQVDTLLASRGTSLAAALPGSELDPDGEFLPPGIVSSASGRLAEVPSLLPLLAGPLAGLFGRRGGFMVTGAVVILCLLAVSRLANLAWGADPRAAGQATLASTGGILATPLLGGGALFEDHALAALALAVAAIPLVKTAPDFDREPGEPTRFWPAGIAAGMVAGLGAWFAAQTLLLLPALILAGTAMWGRRFSRSLIVPILVGAALPVGALLGWGVLTRGRPGSLHLPRMAQMFDSARTSLPIVVLALALVALALLLRRAWMPRAVRFVGLSGTLFLLLCVLMGPAALEQAVGTTLVCGAPLLAIYLVGLISSPVGPRADRTRGLVVAGVIGLGVMTQLVSLRHLADLRLDRSALAARVEAGTPDGAVLLTDSEPLSLLLASQRGAPPVFLVRPGQDAGVLLGRIEEARMEAVWIRASHQTDVGPAHRRQAGDAEIDLGDGLVLVRDESGAGTRGFSQLPAGD